MPELRWTLLALGVLFVAGLVLWDRKRGRGGGAGVGGMAWRDTAVTSSPPSVVVADRGREGADPRDPVTLPDIRLPEGQRELPVIEVDDLDLRNVGTRDGVRRPQVTLLGETAVDAPGASRRANRDTFNDDDEVLEDVGEPVDMPIADDTARVQLTIDWPPENERRFLSVRLVATSDERFAGHAVRQALSSEGFMLGSFDIFHMPMPDGRVVISAASLTKPGTFELATMDAQRYAGLNLFAVLPGPLPEAVTLEELVAVGRMLAQRLGGELRDHRGQALSAERIAEMRSTLSGGAAPTIARGERRG
jgi:cell division protein ZipA